MFDYKKLKKYRGRKAVSPVVATLILIIVAIVGAVAVGLIVSGIGSQTAKGSNVGSAAQGASTVLIVGGSTTLFPAVKAGAAAFNAAHPGIQINVTQGGSGAGMTGVALGVLNIGDSSSASQVAASQSEFPSANLQANEVGGSGVVFIANLPTGVCGTTGTGAVISITQLALQELYATTVSTSVPVAASGYGVPTCAEYGTSGNYQITAFTAGTTTLGAADLGAVSRSDLPSGTEDTACSYLTTAVCAATSSNSVALPGLTETGNPGVLAEVQNTKYTIGFVDIGFAEGASTTPGSTTAAGVTILSVQSTSDTYFSTTTPVAPEECNSASFSSSNVLQTGDCYALPGTSTSALDSYMKASLSNLSPSSSNTVYPDATSGTGLTRTFWMVTAGPADSDAQQFILFMQSPANTNFWTNAGYYSVYQITPITPP